MSAQADSGVIIIGAGAAGLTAGYDLKRKGIPFKILEASSMYGGRVRKVDDFADFPVDVGAEWITEGRDTLKTIVDDRSVKIKPKVHVCNFDSYRIWEDGKWRRQPSVTENELYRFTQYTWFDFLNDYIAKPIQDDIHYNCEVKSIEYSTEKVVVECQDGRRYQGDQVILTVSLKILQDEVIEFFPSLPNAKRNAIENATFEPGMKMFIEFSDDFFERRGRSGFGISDPQNNTRGDLYFWDEAGMRKSTRHVLGVFIYSDLALKYVEQADQDAVNDIISLLDVAFDGRASSSYVKHHVQNWTTETHIRGSYSSFRRGLKPMYTLMRPVQKKIFFAGEALPPNSSEFGYADGAALSGRAAARAVECVRKGRRIPFNTRACLVHLLSILCCGFEHRLFFNDTVE